MNAYAKFVRLKTGLIGRDCSGLNVRPQRVLSLNPSSSHAVHQMSLLSSFHGSALTCTLLAQIKPQSNRPILYYNLLLYGQPEIYSVSEDNAAKGIKRSHREVPHRNRRV